MRRLASIAVFGLFLAVPLWAQHGGGGHGGGGGHAGGFGGAHIGGGGHAEFSGSSGAHSFSGMRGAPSGSRNFAAPRAFSRPDFSHPGFSRPGFSRPGFSRPNTTLRAFNGRGPFLHDRFRDRDGFRDFRFRDRAFLIGVRLGDHVVMTFGGTIARWRLMLVDSSHLAPPMIGSDNAHRSIGTRRPKRYPVAASSGSRTWLRRASSALASRRETCICEQPMRSAI